MSTLKFIDLFGGIGGFRLGLEQSINAECVGYCDIDKHACKVYSHNFGEHHEPQDIKKLKTENLERFDLLTGGFPCQSFSVAGHRAGFCDPRGTMFFELLRIIEDKRPAMFILENVKGLLNHDGGKTFGTIIHALQKLGYSVEWRVFNSQYFNLAQTRERVFIVGCAGGEPRFPLLSLGIGNPNTDRSHEETPGEGERIRGEVSSALDTNYSKGCGCRTMIVEPCLSPFKEEKRQDGRRFKNNGEPAFTLTAQDRHGIKVNGAVRMLTPLECERLQGFPDGWTSILPNTHRYRVLGNAVSVPVIKAIGKAISSNF